MKTNMKCLAIIVLFFCACKKNDAPKPLVQPLTDGSLPSGAISLAQVINHSGSKFTIALDIYIFRDSKNLENQLEAGNFLSDTTTGVRKINKFFSTIKLETYVAVQIWNSKGYFL